MARRKARRFASIDNLLTVNVLLMILKTFSRYSVNETDDAIRQRALFSDS